MLIYCAHSPRPGGPARPARYDDAMNEPDKAEAAQKGAAPRSGESRVAFFGGSFDPPHLGHLAVARAAQAAFALDAVLFAPVGMQPLKPGGPIASFADRLAMTQLAIADQPRFEISLADAPKSPDALRLADSGQSAPNYTIDTLKRLRTSLAPGSTLFCLMGADSFLGLRQWHRAAEIPFVAPLIVASRPGQPLEDLKAALPAGIDVETAPQGETSESGVEVSAFLLVNEAGVRAPLYVLPGLHVEISASDIRAQIYAASGSSAAESDFVPAAVRDYIAKRGLYRS